MSDFDPVTLYFILAESFGPWLWALLALAAILLIGVVAGFVRLRRARRPVFKPLLAAIVAGLATAAALLFAVPAWTLADPSALSAPVDYAFAFLVALVPGAIVASGVFMLAARRSAARSAYGI